MHHRCGNAGFHIVLVTMLFLGACQEKHAQEDSENTSSQENAAVADATGEADIGSATADAKVAEGTGEKTLKKKEVVFKVPVSAERLIRGEMKAYLSKAHHLSTQG